MTAANLARVFDRAQEAREAGAKELPTGSETSDAEVSGAGNAETVSSSAAQQRAKPTLTLPAPEGGGIAYKRTVVAELNKGGLIGAGRLPTDRLQKMRVAARLMAQISPHARTAAEVMTEPDTAASSNDAPASLIPGDGKLRVGSDFGMVFYEEGKGRGKGQKGGGGRRRISPEFGCSG